MPIPESLRKKLESYLDEKGGQTLSGHEPIQGLLKPSEETLGFKPSREQKECLSLLEAYLFSRSEQKVFLLKGSAGSGKTTLASAVVKLLDNDKRRVHVAAPTGRAAKVFSLKAQRSASTIHKMIFNVKERKDKKGNSAGIYFEPKTNPSNKEAIYFIDEASMLPTRNSTKDKTLLFEEKDLLQNLLDYVFEANPKSKIVMVGDPYQLPPVGQTTSPALEEDTYAERGVEASSYLLHSSRRQEAYSAVMNTAAELRELIATADWQKSFSPLWSEGELEWIDGKEKAVRLFVDKYFQNPEQVIFLSYSNKNSADLNRRIREKLWGIRTREPREGDKVMLVRNHYFSKDGSPSLLANGEQGFIDSINWDKKSSIGKYRFVECELELDDPSFGLFLYKNYVNLDLLESSKPSLDTEAYQLMHAMARKMKSRDWDFDRSLELKYGYAITGHKAQGGEWDSVFVLLDAPSSNSALYNRWFYTAITRAKKELYLVNAF